MSRRSRRGQKTGPTTRTRERSNSVDSYSYSSRSPSPPELELHSIYNTARGNQTRQVPPPATPTRALTTPVAATPVASAPATSAPATSAPPTSAAATPVAAPQSPSTGELAGADDAGTDAFDVDMEGNTEAKTVVPDVCAGDAIEPPRGDDHGDDKEELASVDLLDEVSSRLIWTRLHEVESLKASLRELSVAITKVDEIRRSIEAGVDKELESAKDVASTHLAGRVEIRYKQSFSQFFKDLVGHLFRPA